MAITVINATTGKTIFEDASEQEFDRWYDAHPFWRKVRDVSEVTSECQADYIDNANENIVWLVND